MLNTVMNLSYAEPDESWGQRPCEGLVPSSLTCVSARGLAARRTHPGLGAACKGSNAADLLPHSYGGHFGPELRSKSHAKERCSAPAAASQETFKTAVHLDRSGHNCSLAEHGLGLLGMIPGVLWVGGGDPFTAQGLHHA